MTLKTINLSYWYTPETVLFKDVNLDFEAGKIYAILGQSGSGKTTFLSLISGLDTPRSGEVVYNDESLKKIGLQQYRRDDVSIVFQAYNLLPYLTAVENVVSAMEISGSKRTDKKAYALENLAKIGIDEELANKRVPLLSGGQQQRVAIARALCCDHDLIVADEPTGNLDEKTSNEIIQLFLKIAHEQNKCIIIVTHESEIARQCDVIYELRDKKFELVD